MSLQHDAAVANAYRCRQHVLCWGPAHIPHHRLAQDASRYRPGCPCWRHPALRWAYLHQFEPGPGIAAT